MMGTHFTLERGEEGLLSAATSRPCSSSGDSSNSIEHNLEVAGEVALVLYKPNLLGTGGPRKMLVLLPQGGTMVGRGGLFESWERRQTQDLVVFCSKEATWDKTLNSYVLNYHGRASQVETKNEHCCL